MVQVDDLEEIKPDFDLMLQFSEKNDVVGIQAFCLSAEESIKVRFFAPRYGINEESATGTSNCVLGALLH